MYKNDDVIKEVLVHRERVSTKMSLMANDLAKRGRRHDNSKTGDTELDLYLRAKNEPAVNNRILAESLHAATNDHHISFFGGNVAKMNLFQLMEFVADQMVHVEDAITNPTIDDYMDVITHQLNNPSDSNSDENNTIILSIISNTIESLIKTKKIQKGVIDNKTGGVVDGKEEK